MSGQFKDIIDQYNAILYKIGRSYTSTEEDFKDLYQEMLIQLWQALRKFKAKAKLSTFIYRVALNTAITHKTRRKKKMNAETLESTMPVIADETKNLLEQEDQRNSKIDLLYKCINRLDKDDRAIILLHLEGQTYEEIAEITGITSNNVGVKLNRIRKKLFQLLNAYGYAEI